MMARKARARLSNIYIVPPRVLCRYRLCTFSVKLQDRKRESEEGGGRERVGKRKRANYTRAIGEYPEGATFMVKQ